MANSNAEDLGVMGIVEDVAHKSNDKDIEFDTLIGHLQDIVLEVGFQDLQDGFLSEHSDEFDEEEENKLVYMEIYNSYITKIEGYISKRLKELHPSFQMDLLLSMIQSRRDEVDPELFDTLASFADFVLFKETMLNYKSQRDNEMGEFPTLVVTSMACGLPRS
ncbi:ADP-ribosylation factor-like protein 2-binding protein [Bolinopsis microptera]|uniref:ADP-ribosylation factor-like protein 2-binding protein n=1 Tax=Bolinopsis microptera TaxID=2820187 RepID=UPI00307A274A